MAEQLAFIRFTALAGDGERAEGTWGNDRIDALIGDQRDEFFGYGGDDILNGNGGDDLLDGGYGNDELNGGDGNDTLSGGDGSDKISGGFGNDLIEAGAGSDVISAGAGHDYVNAGTDNDTVNGDEGNDVLDGGQGNDYVFGGQGNDTITDISGVDRLKGGIGDDTITVRGGDLGFDTVEGGSGNDTITMTRSKIIAHGNNDNDTFYTDLSRETFMIGGEGSDRFVVTGAHPIGIGRIAEIHGGDTSVTTTSFLGIDSVSTVTVGADTSVDTLDLSQLPSTVGRVSVNLASGTMHDDAGVLLANMRGIEDVIGTSRADTITGNSAVNVIRGGAGDDTINGAGGDDTLIGGSGRDTIVGGTGRDRILGDHLGDAAARDTLTGGADSDTFVFTNRGTVLSSTSTQIGGSLSLKDYTVTDRITDFDTSGLDRDQLDLSALFDLHTNFNGTAQQAIDAGYIYFLQNGSTTTVMFDTNGGSHTDTANNSVVAELDGVTRLDLRADHFII